MAKKECPSCAMEIEKSAKTCPICGYEFAVFSKTYRVITFILILLFLWLIIF